MRLSLPIIFFATVLPFALEAVDYEEDIAPIFEANCLDCHGPDKDKSGFRVDLRAQMIKGGDTGFAAIVPGDWEGSYLMEVVTHLDEEMAMPPKGDKLPDEDIELLKEWVNAGAEWPGQMDAVLDDGTDHWSFHPVVRPEVPGGGSTPVDSFLEAKLKEEDIAPNGPATPHALIRRASITLTGLPPTPDRVESFLADYGEDGEAAYLGLVDELLASPHFGERWAQHWLDSIRWAETNGSEANLYRKNSWIYRDYVVRAFNEDVPYDQFITEQLAGDQLGVGEATGFLVAGPHVPAATVGREPAAIRQARADRVDEVMQTIGASMLGVTVNCARCHNHKFDPISIQDYYALTAVFQGVEFGGRYPEFSDDHPRKLRAGEIRSKMFKQREVLRQGVGRWKEDWGGFSEFSFPPTKTKVVRIEFSAKNVGVDELQLFGTEDYSTNLALARNGATLATGDGMTKENNHLEKANDGRFGTMAWRTALPKGSKEKPWVEIHLPESTEVSRFRFSSNREYYFETDYLEGGTAKYLPGFKISAKQEDGSWKELGNTAWAEQKIKADPNLQKASDRLHEFIAMLGDEGPQYSFVGDFTAMPEVTRVLHRGSPENPRDEVVPAGFEIMDGDLGLDSSSSDPERRLRFADWLTEESNPLTARVMVNRIWHHIFGSGIVPTATDFGHAGADPSHPELLDWLASEFIEEDWSMKEMIRTLVMSDAFQRSSAPTEAGMTADAGAFLLWRYPPRRVAAEVIRDGILQASGKLNSDIGGKSFRIHNVKKTYAQWEVVDNHGPETWRRMLYQERMRRVDDKMFTAFDFPDCGQVRAKRPVSTTPLQALNLMNSDFVIDQSKYIAERAKEEAGEEGAASVRRAFELLLGREPSSEELAACEGIELTLVCRSLINSNEYAFLP
ncbi:MAG: PSD1 and planctomycete cytochrome C domain-containing protein [Verrucomicrobiales bacterium]|nr:PSD1 and planctomycete cytochrome C domain-containing protein [Verrucomicrobiales bacterium]